MRSGDTQSSADEESGSAFSIGDILAIGRRRALMIVGVTVLLTSAAAAVAMLIPNRYEATTFIQVDPREKRVTGIDGVIQDLKGDVPSIESEVELILSSRIQLKVIADLGLRNDPELTKPSGLGSVIRKLVGLGEADAVPWLERPLEKPPTDLVDLTGARADGRTPVRDYVLLAFADRVKTKRLRNTLLISISYASGDPVKAARVADAIAETYIASQIESKTNASVVTNQLLEQKLGTLKTTLADAERKLERFRTANNAFDQEGALVVERQFARETEALQQARQRTAEAGTKFEQARRMGLNGEGSDALTNVLQSNSVNLQRDELTKAQRKQAELRTKYGPLHPEMQRINADIAKAQSALTETINAILRNLKVELQVAQNSEQKQQARTETLKAELDQIRSKEWQLRALERDVKTSRVLYEGLLARRKQMAETVGLQFPDSRLVERAGVPVMPAAPKRTQIVLIAGVGSLGMALGLAFLLELMAPGFARPEDIERALDLPCIAKVPELPHVAATDGALRRNRMMLVAPASGFTESVRELRHAIDMTPCLHASRVVMFASALPGEGKSLIAANLALHYAMTGVSTLLIDADVRRGSLTRDHGALGRGGLSEVLTGRLPIQRVLLTDTTCGLSLLPSASQPDFGAPAAELLAGPALPDLLARLAPQFQMIIIDAPPLLPVVDGRILASLVDDIVMVMTTRSTPKALAKRSLKLLGRDAEKVIGVVVNRTNPAEGLHATPYGRSATLSSSRQRQAA